MKALQVKQPGFVPGTAQTDCGINRFRHKGAGP